MVFKLFETQIDNEIILNPLFERVVGPVECIYFLNWQWKMVYVYIMTTD